MKITKITTIALVVRGATTDVTMALSVCRALELGCAIST